MTVNGVSVTKVMPDSVHPPLVQETHTDQRLHLTLKDRAASCADIQALFRIY